MNSGLPPWAVQLNNQGTGQPRRLEQHGPSSFQPPIRQMSEIDYGKMPPPNQPMISSQPSSQYVPRPSLISPHNARTQHQPTPEPPSRRHIDVVDIRDVNITEAEARKRLSSYTVVRIEKSTDPYAIDDEGNPVSPTWEKASHMIQRDISQQEVGRKVRELNQETGPVSDKKNNLSSALQRQLEHAWNKLADTESDRRFVYTLAQLDWKIKRVEAPKEHHRKHDKRSKDKKRGKERHRSKELIMSKPKKERVSVTAYFKREPSRNEDCVRMYTRQQEDKIVGEGLAFNGRSPMGSTLPPLLPPPQQLASLPPIQIPPRSLPGVSSAEQPPNLSWNSIPRASKGSDRRVQFDSTGMERQGTSGSQNSRSSATSFASFSSEDSQSNLTLPSSVENRSPHYHHEGGRGRSRYRQHGDGESFGLEVARQQKPRNLGQGYEGILPPAPDPIREVPDTDILRRVYQRAYHEGMMEGQVMARSVPVRNPSRQPRIIQNPLNDQRDSFCHDTSGYSPGGEDMDRLGDRLSRALLADEPQSRQKPARDSTSHCERREPPRRHYDDADEVCLIPESSRNTWRKQDAQRYMASRQRSDQDEWDQGSSTPLGYTENPGRVAGYTDYRR